VNTPHSPSDAADLLLTRANLAAIDDKKNISVQALAPATREIEPAGGLLGNAAHAGASQREHKLRLVEVQTPDWDRQTLIVARSYVAMSSKAVDTTIPPVMVASSSAASSGTRPPPISLSRHI